MVKRAIMLVNPIYLPALYHSTTLPTKEISYHVIVKSKRIQIPSFDSDYICPMTSRAGSIYKLIRGQS